MNISVFRHFNKFLVLTLIMSPFGTMADEVDSVCFGKDQKAVPGRVLQIEVSRELKEVVYQKRYLEIVFHGEKQGDKQMEFCTKTVLITNDSLDQKKIHFSIPAYAQSVEVLNKFNIVNPQARYRVVSFEQSLKDFSDGVKINLIVHSAVNEFVFGTYEDFIGIDLVSESEK